jgi:hypothetical protein
MNRPPLRLARPGQLPAPATGQDSLQVLDEAIDQLARLRTPCWLGDSAVRLHALASLIAQAERLLPQAVHDARDQELTWAQIGELLGTTATTAARRGCGSFRVRWIRSHAPLAGESAGTRSAARWQRSASRETVAEETCPRRATGGRTGR